MMNFLVDFANYYSNINTFKKESEITTQVIDWLYEHSGGVTSVVVSLVHDAQEIAILTRHEMLDIAMLNQAYEKRMQLLHDFIRPAAIVKNTTAKRKKKTIEKAVIPSEEDYSIADLVQKSKAENLDIVEVFREHFIVEEIAL